YLFLSLDVCACESLSRSPSVRVNKSSAIRSEDFYGQQISGRIQTTPKTETGQCPVNTCSLFCWRIRQTERQRKKNREIEWHKTAHRFVPVCMETQLKPAEER
ncbi:hypothetical protein BaRGS_00023719, partial [Batillaria attramentaria]